MSRLKYVLVVSKNSRSTSRFNRSAIAKNTAAWDLALGVGLDERVHRAVGLVLIHLGQSGDVNVLPNPLRRGELGGRLEAAVGDQGEERFGPALEREMSISSTTRGCRAPAS